MDDICTVFVIVDSYGAARTLCPREHQLELAVFRKVIHVVDLQAALSNRAASGRRHVPACLRAWTVMIRAYRDANRERVAAKKTRRSPPAHGKRR